MEYVPGVTFFQGDFTEQDTRKKIKEWLQGTDLSTDLSIHLFIYYPSYSISNPSLLQIPTMTGREVDAMLSDMAPKATGKKSLDHNRLMVRVLFLLSHTYIHTNHLILFDLFIFISMICISYLRY